MIVQIYEIQTAREALTMIDLNVEHVGSVLTSAEALQDRQIKNQIKKTIQTVQAAGCKSCLIPLFTDLDLICQAMAYYQPDIVHFCESLPLDIVNSATLASFVVRQTTVRERFADIEIMRSIPIGQNGHGNLAPSLELAKHFEPHSDWFLTDTLLASHTQSLDADQPVAGYVGITGVTCDWDIARDLVAQSDIPVILAGGIGPDNVSKAIAHTRPAGVDSCTQTNRVDDQGQAIRFQKDPEKVRVMVEKAKHHTRNTNLNIGGQNPCSKAAICVKD